MPGRRFVDAGADESGTHKFCLLEGRHFGKPPSVCRNGRRRVGISAFPGTVFSNSPITCIARRRVVQAGRAAERPKMRAKETRSTGCRSVANSHLQTSGTGWISSKAKQELRREYQSILSESLLDPLFQAVMRLLAFRQAL